MAARRSATGTTRCRPARRAPRSRTRRYRASRRIRSATARVHARDDPALPCLYLGENLTRRLLQRDVSDRVTELILSRQQRDQTQVLDDQTDRCFKVEAEYSRYTPPGSQVICKVNRHGGTVAPDEEK